MNSHGRLRMYWGGGLGLNHTGSRHDRHRKASHLFACRDLGGRIRTCPGLRVVVIDKCYSDFVKRRSHVIAGLVERLANFISSFGECFSSLVEGAASLLTALEGTTTGGIT